MTSAPAIGFEYRPSRRLGQVLWLVAALAMLAVALSGLAWGMQVPLLLIVLLATWRARRAVARSPVLAAGWSADSGWTLHLRSREDVPATLASFRVLGNLVLLRLHTGGRGVQVLLLAPDNSDADIRRRLRMRLATLPAGDAVPRA